jgi:hypothetical protein
VPPPPTSPTPQPLFDSGLASHKTMAERRLVGPTQAWYINAFLAALVSPDGETRCLLPTGFVVRFYQDAQGLIDLEVIGEEEVP